MPDSVELKVKLAAEDVVVVAVGVVESMVVLGSVVSTVQLWLAGVSSVLPAVSMARTRKAWSCEDRPV